jgi:hypothetical protein
MLKALSGTVNLNTFPKGKLQNTWAYRGVRNIPAVRSEPRYAGAEMFRDSPSNFAYEESRIPSMKRQARPYGVY